MHAIIIKDEDAVDLLERLELEKFKINDGGWNSSPEEIHRRFHYIVTSWLQEQGARCVRS